MNRHILCGVAAFLLLTGLPALGSGQVRRQQKIGVGYSFLRETGSSAARYPTGWVLDVATAPAPVISGVGEVSAHYRTPAGGVRQTLSSYQGGLRLTPMTGSLIGFVQVLAGLERYAEPGFSEHGFAVQPGGGVEIPVGDRYAIRGQVDYRFVRVGARSGVAATTFNELRAVIGVAIGLGR
jgi:hypothetical protein